MELRQLKYFIKAAETLNFSEAAKASFITQSTLSQQIRQLETELDVQLFQRNSHEVALTEAGEELLPYARHTIHSAESCFDRLHDLKQMLTGTLNIGVTYTFSPILTETVLTFMQRYPQVKLNIYYKTMEELMQMLEKREVDFVLAFKPTQRYEQIESHILFDNHLSAIVRTGHPLSAKEKISMNELEPYELALPSRGLQARNTFECILAQRDYRLKVRIELNEVNILLKLIKGSDLVTILSEATIHDEADVKAIPLDTPENEMEGCIHMLRNTYRKHSAQEFIRLLGESKAVKERRHNWLG
ncbi:MAG: LysR substrate-binding domain-containing protein [Bacteroidales bacterium]|nr:LysR substrate-binding domain-containing protein [Bacteroidales bacterium]